MAQSKHANQRLTPKQDDFCLTFLCLNVGVRSALAIGLVRRFDFLDDDIDQFPHGAGW